MARPGQQLVPGGRLAVRIGIGALAPFSAPESGHSSALSGQGRETFTNAKARQTLRGVRIAALMFVCQS